MSLLTTLLEWAPKTSSKSTPFPSKMKNWPDVDRSTSLGVFCEINISFVLVVNEPWTHNHNMWTARGLDHFLCGVALWGTVLSTARPKPRLWPQAHYSKEAAIPRDRWVQQHIKRARIPKSRRIAVVAVAKYYPCVRQIPNKFVYEGSLADFLRRFLGGWGLSCGIGLSKGNTLE